MDHVINTLRHYSLPGKLNDFNIDNHIVEINPQTRMVEHRVIAPGIITQQGFPKDPKLEYKLSGEPQRNGSD
ncbi:MAG: hypothetical protein AB3N34_01230 [Lettuce witches'-broom phytoplasma]